VIRVWVILLVLGGLIFLKWVPQARKIDDWGAKFVERLFRDFDRER
jgi:hypothetical protein